MWLTGPPCTVKGGSCIKQYAPCRLTIYIYIYICVCVCMCVCVCVNNLSTVSKKRLHTLQNQCCLGWHNVYKNIHTKKYSTVCHYYCHFQQTKLLLSHHCKILVLGNGQLGVLIYKYIFYFSRTHCTYMWYENPWFTCSKRRTCMICSSNNTES